MKQESSQELGMVQEELDSRLQELEKVHQASLNDLRQTLIVNEKKLQEKHHEPVSHYSIINLTERDLCWCSEGCRKSRHCYSSINFTEQGFVGT